ncbi:hypothetical protein D3C86_2169530 [compost metagenome]
MLFTSSALTTETRKPLGLPLLSSTDQLKVGRGSTVLSFIRMLGRDALTAPADSLVSTLISRVRVLLPKVAP